MRVNRARWIGLVIALGLLALTAGVVLAQNGGYELNWWTIDGGGVTSQGGEYALSGTIGQPDAGTVSGGGYRVTGGFWSAAVLPYDVYIPLVVKNVSG